VQLAQAGRGFTRLAMAIILAGVLVSATIYATVGQTPRTLTGTITNTLTGYITETESTTLTVSNPSAATTTILITTTSFRTTTVIQTVTSATTSTQSGTVNSVSGANGLTLRLSVNISTSSSGVTVSGIAGDYNLRASATNVIAADAWSVPKQVLLSHFCAIIDSPVGVSIAQGHYAPSNVSSAKFLTFINPAVTYTCTEPAPDPIATYTFSPMSDVAIARGSCGSTTCGYNTTASDQIVASGSYVGEALSGFAPGQYTVVAGDEWGNSLLACFTVP
jgi:hypothetical protein